MFESLVLLVFKKLSLPREKLFRYGTVKKYLLHFSVGRTNYIKYMAITLK